MKIGEANQYLQQALQKIYNSSESGNIAQLVIEDCTGYSKSRLLLQKQDELSAEQEKKLHEHLQRLQTHEPIHYVLNKAWFYGMELYVDNSVLIPRPETEELVHWIVSDVKASGANVFERGPMQADVTTQLKILDIGTGSGCIALALKKTMPKAEVWGCDVSEEALNVARRNGSILDIRVDFQGINFLDEAQQTFLPTVDIIVSNPPYIPIQDKTSMQPNVVNFEPHTALFVPNDDALLFYKAIATFAKKRLYDKGAIYLEIHEDLVTDVVNLFRNEGYALIDVRKDMQGKERMVKVVSSQ
ncbi:MAG TPA: peptide chain release factor N(5)-glutamine methyltransferase [Flavisolibacter sp.]|jgi:release factor glutamine methyltransferase|nr:peptide chain release factor N(5)-glutamine methyltransferase [Flavisolibacter sp.]